MEQQTLWDTESDESPITIQALEEMCMAAAEQTAMVKTMEANVKEQKALLLRIKNKIQEELVKIDKSKYTSDVGTFYIQTNFSVKTPKTDEEKEAFFDWAKEKEIYWQYVSVNSRSLQSLYKSMLESEGEDFVMPGVPEPTSFEELRFRKANK